MQQCNCCSEFLLYPRRRPLPATPRGHSLDWSVAVLAQLAVVEPSVWFCFLCLLAVPTVQGLAEFMDTYDSNEAYTNVSRDPIFLSRDTNVTVREGAKAELPCTIQHLGTKKVAWRRVDLDKFLTIGKLAWTPDEEILVHHVKHSEELEDWTLILPRVKKSDAGVYECQLTSIGGYHALVHLSIVGPPLTNPEVTLNGTQFVERGRQIELQCNATGGEHIAEEIDWFKDGNIISGPRYKDYLIFTYRSQEQGALVSTLQVDRATAQHAGTYVCRSSYNKLKDIVVQVLVADSNNVKRGMSQDFPDQYLPRVDPTNSSRCPATPGVTWLYLLVYLTVCARWCEA